MRLYSGTHRGARGAHWAQQRNVWLTNSQSAQEAKEGALGSSAARQANCQVVARSGELLRGATCAIALDGREQDRQMFSHGVRLLFPVCFTTREWTVLAAASEPEMGCEGQGFPPSSRDAEPQEPMTPHSSQDASKDSPDPRSQRTGSRATNPSFARFIRLSTGECPARSFRNMLRFIMACALFHDHSHSGSRQAITKSISSCNRSFLKTL